MSKVRVSITLLIASLILLIIYGADVMTTSLSDSISKQKRGFLPFDESIRGSVFGGGAITISVVAFAISKEEYSSKISGLLIVNGGLIVAGMVILIAQGALTSGAATAAGTIGSTLVLGALLIGLGIWGFVEKVKI